MPRIESLFDDPEDLSLDYEDSPRNLRDVMNEGDCLASESLDELESEMGVCWSDGPLSGKGELNY